MTKSILRLTAAGSLLALSALMILTAKYFGKFFFKFYLTFSCWIAGILAGLTSVVPFAVCEILLALLPLWLLFSLIRAVICRHFVRWLTGLLLMLCILVTSFLGIWGLNYYAPPMQERLALEERRFTVADLEEATAYYRDRAAALAPLVERDREGVMKQYDFSVLSEQAGEGYRALAKDMDCFNGSTVRVKKLLSSSLQGKLGMSGIFVCLTGECCVSTTAHAASMPFIMCHEIGHRMAFARESEANFAAFLACTASTRTEFRYSGYYAAFRYCYDALEAQSPEAAARIWVDTAQEIKADWNAAIEHHDALRSEKAAELAGSVYDTYLKSFSVDSDADSYGEVADLLLPWYFERLK